MAERVLPSRESVAIDLALAEVDLSDAPLRDILTIAHYWQSGRLVDREAIDYEAAYRWASENFVPHKFVDQCFEAALPDQVV